MSATGRAADQVLGNVAHELRRARGDSLGAAMADGGKTLLESDPEVSEAVDFVEFYATNGASTSHSLASGGQAGRESLSSFRPWNFPIAIPCGGVAAALAAGNTVILKPASDTVLPPRSCASASGTPAFRREALQLVPCAARLSGAALAGRTWTSVILTGGTETALRILSARPDMHLLAETGGKNATIVTRCRDRDLAIKNVLHSAFGHGGQKCSATQLAALGRGGFSMTLIFGRDSVDAVREFDRRLGLGPEDQDGTADPPPPVIWSAA